MQWILSMAAGLFVVIFGVEVVRFLFENLMGLYSDLSLTDACLILLVIIQTTMLVRMVLWQRQPEEEGVPSRRRPKLSPRPASAGQRPPSSRRGAAHDDADVRRRRPSSG
ncbi:MAG: hypothetical protein N2512_11500 [Armatimonadetes bacterium]|nr:hypothetical protein [Armatimonadota bacterium]